MDIGQAVKAMKDGNKVTRTGWNGTFMYLMYVPGDNWSVDELDIEPSHLSGETADWIGIKTQDGRFVPWTPSQTDMLEEDWKIVA